MANRKPANDGFIEDGFVEEGAGSAGIGQPDGFQEEKPPTMKDRLYTLMRATGKALDYPSIATRGMVGKMTGTISQKEIDAAIAMNGMLPDSNEMMKRAKVGEGGHLSDLLPFFEKPGLEQADRKWVPNAGGDYDPSFRAIGGFAADMLMDPLNWLSAGAAGAAKRAARPAYQAPAKNLAEKAWRGAVKAGDTVADGITMIPYATYNASQKIPGLKQAVNAADMVASAPSKLAQKTGRVLYERGLQPIIDFGEKRGKDVADTYYRYGINNLDNLHEKLQKRMSGLKEFRDSRLVGADKLGASVSREAAWDPMFTKVKELVEQRRITPEEGEKLIKTLSERYAAGADPSTLLATQWKTDIRKGIPDAYWNEFATRQPTIANELRDLTGTGLQKEIEKSVASKSGKKAGQELHNANADLGDFLTTQDKAVSYGNKVQAEGFPFDVIDLAMLSGEIPIPGSTTAGIFLGRKALQLYKNPGMKMRLGHMLRKGSEGQLAAPAMNAIIRGQMIDRERKRTDEERDAGK